MQDAYKYDSVSLLAGVDYRMSDSLVIGGAISYSDTHSDYDRSLGKVKAATIGVAGYGTYYVDNWYVDDPFGQSAPSVCGVSGSPSMSTIFPSLT